MKKIYPVLIMAVAMAACTRSEQPQLPDEPGAPKTYKMSIEATKAPITRALQYDEDNYSLSAFWKKGEKVAVVTPDLSSSAGHLIQIGELTAQGDGLSTILSGEIDGASVNNLIMFMYPRFPIDYRGQKGTLEDLAQRYDYSYQGGYSSSFTVSGGEITGSISDPFMNMQAIIRFHLEDVDGNPIIADQLSIHDSNNQLVLVGYMGNDDDNTYGDIIISLDDSSYEIWAALGYFNGNRTFNLTLTATAGEHYYVCNVGQKTLQSNYFYPVKAVMYGAYKVTVDPNTQNGSIKVSPSDLVVEGTAVTLTMVPAEHYVFESLYVNGNLVPSEDVIYNTYSFTPESNVTVSATFKYVEGGANSGRKDYGDVVNGGYWGLGY